MISAVSFAPASLPGNLTMPSVPPKFRLAGVLGQGWTTCLMFLCWTLVAGNPGERSSGGRTLAHEVVTNAVAVVARQPDAGQVTRIAGQCFGPISYQVTVGANISDAERASLATAIQQRLDEINQKMSTYVQDSDVSRFNREPSTGWFAVDLETASVVALALEISQQTEGAFDITVGPLVAAWKFGAADQAADADPFVPPTAEAIAALLPRVGYEKLEARLEPPALRKQVVDLEIDLSAIAKGYAVDQVAEVLEQHGQTHYFVEVGEEVRAAGQHPAGRPWNCGIEKPLELQRVIEIIVPLREMSIATSGDYRQFRWVDGRRYAHTIDPRSGYPTDGQVALASIAATRCAVADAWATAAMVLGGERTQALAQQHGLGLHLVTRNETGQLTSLQNNLYPAAIPTGPAGPNWLVMVGATVLVFGLALAGMSIGVIFKRKPLAGSCGGLANLPNSAGQSPCELCSNPSQECRELGRGTRAAKAASTKANL
jgi:FAD:protein FMN transferase